MDDIYNNTGLIVAAVTVLLSTCIYLFLTATHNYWKDRGVPYVKPLPFFGNIKDQILNKRNFGEILTEMCASFKGQKFAGYFEMRKPVLIVLDPELVEKVLVKDFTHFYDHGFPVDTEYEPLSAHLFTLNGDAWRNLRYKLTPAFTTGKLKGMFEQISNCGNSVVKYIEDEPDTPVQIAPLMDTFALDVIASCAFGLQMNEDNETNKSFRKAVKEVFEPSTITIIKNSIKMCWPNLGKRLGFKMIPTNAEKLIMTIVKETLKFREGNSINRNDFMQLMLNLRKRELTDKSDLPRELEQNEDDVIDQMRHTGEKGDSKKVEISDEIIAAQLFMFLGGGSDTISVTVGNCLYLLAQHPEIQAKVQKEIDSAIKQSGNNLSHQVIKELTYMDQVIQETLRLHPASAVLFRECTQPYKLPDSNVILEKGTHVVIPVLDIHHDPANYDCPDLFKPERFVDNNFKPSGIYLPFGDGPRICIAMRFAVLEMKVVLARLLSQYTVKLNAKTQLPIQFNPSKLILSPKHGLWFDFNKRMKS